MPSKLSLCQWIIRLWLTQPIHLGMCYICNMSRDMGVCWKISPSHFLFGFLQILSSCPLVICAHQCCNKRIHRCSCWRNPTFYPAQAEFYYQDNCVVAFISYLDAKHHKARSGTGLETADLFCLFVCFSSWLTGITVWPCSRHTK